MIQVGFSSPAPGSIVNTTFTVTGFVFDDGDKGSFPSDSRFDIFQVFVRFGTNGSGVLVQQDQDGHWSATGSLPPGTQHGQAVTLTVTCTGSVVSNDNSHEGGSFEVTGTLQVAAEQTPPQLVINAFDNDETVEQVPFRVPLVSGQALDSSGVTRVQYTIDNGPRHDVDSVAGDPTQVSWSTANLDFDAGQHTLTVIATDQFGNEGSASTSVTVRVSAPPPDALVTPPAPAPVTPLDLRFTPTFSHRNWHNNVDRIVADGPNGFNVRFDAIDSDLRQAATVVGLINTALSQTGAIGQQTLTPGLEFVPLSFPGFGGWRYDQVGAVHPDGGSGGGFAVMGLTLPEQATLISFRAIGHWPGGHDLGIGLFRSPLTDATKSEKLAAITESTPGMTNPFDLTVPVTAALATVDPGRFRYYVLAQAGFVANPSAISLSTIQLVHTSA
jgi:hypothetical protein